MLEGVRNIGEWRIFQPECIIGVLKKTEAVAGQTVDVVKKTAGIFARVSPFVVGALVSRSKCSYSEAAMLGLGLELMFSSLQGNVSLKDAGFGGMEGISAKFFSQVVNNPLEKVFIGGAASVIAGIRTDWAIEYSRKITESFSRRGITESSPTAGACLANS